MHFLQSPEWEKFQQSIGREVYRIEGVLVIKLPLIFNKSYLYSAGTPDIWRAMDLIKALAKKENAVFLRVEPMAEKDGMGEKMEGYGFKKSNKNIQPQKTIILDITKDEDALMDEMHKKTRYNIRLSGKHNLKIMDFGLRIEDSAFEKFWGLLQKTADRDTFHTHIKDYYKKLLETPITKLFGVEYEGKLIAGSIVSFYDGRATYLHGASDWKHRNVMAPYLLLWEAMKFMKKKFRN